MRLPIALALGWPDRTAGSSAAVDWTAAHTWELRPLDEAAFPGVRLAKAAGRAGCCRPAIYNAANEECVAAFVAGTLPFLGILVYLISNHQGMAERNVKQAESQKAAFDQYVKETAGGSATEIAKAKELLDAGTISQAEFDAIKAKAVSS